MSTEINTLAALLGLDDRARAEASATVLARSGKLVASRVLPGALRQAAAASLIDASVALLQSPLSEVFGSVWKKARDLHQFTDQTKYPPGQVSEYTLATHDVSLKRTPAIELVLDGAPTGLQLEFELKVALSVFGAVLKIQDGRIIGGRVGDFQGSGTYSCGTVKLAERKTTKFHLPGDLAFAPGVSLGG